MTGVQTCALPIYAAQQGIDLICGIGPLSRHLVDGAVGCDSLAEALWFKTKAEFLDAAKDLIKEGDNVLVKASHGMQFPEIVDTLKALGE